MRYKLLAAFVFISCGLQAQQINPVPDYVFQNRMSVGRTTVTDTLAYFSMGPRYGAIRGFMPPMVVDTALVTGGTKRNGLTIFSIQKNKYMYWDSVRVQWSDFAGSSGAYIFATDTASMLSPYTRGSGTVNYLPKFTGTRTFGNSQIYDDGIGVSIGSITPGINKLYVSSGTVYFDTSLQISNVFYVNENTRFIGINRTPNFVFDIANRDTTNDQFRTSFRITKDDKGTSPNQTALTFDIRSSLTAANNMVRVVAADGTTDRNISFKVDKFLVKDTASAGAYDFQVKGSIYNTADAYFAQSSGSVGIGTTSPSTYAGAKFTVYNSGGNAIAAFVSGSSTSGAGFYIAGSNLSNNWFQIRQYSESASGTTFGENNAGSLQFFTASTSTSALIINQQAAQPFIFGTNNAERMRITSAGELLIGTTSDAGAYVLQVAGSIYNTTTITTGAPTSGTAKPWRLGEAATVSPTSPNRTIRVEIDGTVYYLHAKTTND